MASVMSMASAMMSPTVGVAVGMTAMATVMMSVATILMFTGGFGRSRRILRRGVGLVCVKIIVSHKNQYPFNDIRQTADEQN